MAIKLLKQEVRDPVLQRHRNFCVARPHNCDVLHFVCVCMLKWVCEGIGEFEGVVMFMMLPDSQVGLAVRERLAKFTVI